ncbi:MAG: hypothetical protein R3C05_12205 [Pirellulaceae bacterium]
MSIERTNRQSDSVPKGPPPPTQAGPAAANAALRKHFNPPEPTIRSEAEKPKKTVPLEDVKRSKRKRYVKYAVLILGGTGIVGLAEAFFIFNSQPRTVSIPIKGFETRETVSLDATNDDLIATIAELEEKLARVTRERDVLKEALMLMKSD